MRRIHILLLTALTLLAGAAFPQAPATRQDALAALASADAAARADAVVWIARNGAEADAAPLYDRLRDASPRVRSFAEQALWMLWSRSGDEAVDRLLERGADEMQSGRHGEAIATFSEVIRRKPAFAEGWNKRATALFLAGELRKSLADCNEVMKRNPNHFGALAGYGQIYFRLEQYEKAIEYWRRALRVNPNMGGVEDGIKNAEEKLEERRRHS